MVELDVRRSVDGALLVNHDPAFAAGGIGAHTIAELTLAEIRRLEPRIPLLDEALELLRGRVAVEIEIKNAPGEPGYDPSGRSIASDVVAAVHEHRFPDALVASFDRASLQAVKEVDRDLPTGLLVDGPIDLDEMLEAATACGDAFLLPEAAAVAAAGKAFVERAHDRDLAICAWTVDDPAAIERLFHLGCDAVETNDPAVGVAVRDRMRAR
jgi:glycerophosphoryl diester phosphodiesterase